MADTADETPAQRQARIRRQKREAKITGSATERLDKITRLSGRTPETTRHESPAPTPPRAAAPPSQATSPSGTPDATTTAEQRQAQEEYVRALLRQPMPAPDASEPAPDDDPMLKMLQAMMGGLDGSAAGGGGGGSPGAMGAGGGGGFGLSPEEVSKATGLPSFLTKMVLGGPPAAPTAAEVRATRLWRVVHVVLAVVAGLYLVVRVQQATATYGDGPPAPATVQNPFVVFATGEVAIQATRALTHGHSGKRGLGLWIQMARDFIGDGAVMVFLLGVACWWTGGA